MSDYNTQRMLWHELVPSKIDDKTRKFTYTLTPAKSTNLHMTNCGISSNRAMISMQQQQQEQDDNTLLSSSLTPTIKNHSVTYFQNHLYCFGGYDGLRNHSSLWIFDLMNKFWYDGNANNHNVANANASTSISEGNSWIIRGQIPPGRNGHTATLATHFSKVIIIGGWLGSGPLAASDMYVLDVSEGATENVLTWYQPEVRGAPPGPCNMHSADYVESRQEVYVFRGGNGREYLNDLHALHADTYQWRRVETTGTPPQPRANHSSAILNNTNELFIFGGWNGRQRLNDIHILDVERSCWSSPHVGGVVPHARAGMSLTALRDRLYLFGGSGTSSKCFDDLQVLDRKEMTWLDVSVVQDATDENIINRRNGLSQYNINSDQREYRLNDWTSREHLIDQHQSNANPNDEAFVQSIHIVGDRDNAPGKRAGHTATAVHGRFLYIFGGSCGSDYLNDFFMLDTDPPPQTNTFNPTTLQLFERRLCHFLNDEEFSDVTFLVEGQRVYGHRMVLSLVSDCFRAMFTTRNSFKEANLAEIEIPNCSHSAFMLIMEYIYTGKEPRIYIDSGEGMAEGISKAVELLELADQFFLDHLKQVCESILQPAVNSETFDSLLQVAIKTNAVQLEAMCRHFERNQENIAASIAS